MTAGVQENKSKHTRGYKRSFDSPSLPPGSPLISAPAVPLREGATTDKEQKIHTNKTRRETDQSKKHTKIRPQLKCDPFPQNESYVDLITSGRLVQYTSRHNAVLCLNRACISKRPKPVWVS